jgi:hypothetical protein
MPKEIIEGFAYLKAAAYANCDLGFYPAENVMRLQQRSVRKSLLVNQTINSISYLANRFRHKVT